MARRKVGGLPTSSSNSAVGAGTFTPDQLIDPRNLNDFWDDLLGMAGKFASASKTMQMWCNEKGNGLYTAAGARMGVLLIRSVIDGKTTIPGTNWPGHSAEHIAAKEAMGYSTAETKQSIWRFRGNVYKNINARRRGKGWEIGVNKRMSVTVQGFRSIARYTRTRKRIPIHRYASWVEYGTSYMDPRPLFAPTAQYYASQVGPQMNKLVTRSVNRIAKNYKIKKSNIKKSGKRNAVLSSRYSEEAIDEIEFQARTGKDRMNVTHDAGQTKAEKNKSFKEVEKLIKKVTGKKLTVEEQWLVDHAAELEVPVAESFDGIW